MRIFRLRTKFLLSLLAISAGLTSATLLIVGYSVRKQVRAAVRDDLRNSVNTYRSFAGQREVALRRSGELLANLPNLRALMTTHDPATIQDASADIWRLSGSDLLVLADRAGIVVGLRSGANGFARDIAQEHMRRSLERGEAWAWWFGGGHLFEVWIQAIYFGGQSEDTTLGFLAVGHEVDRRAAMEFSSIASSEVAFQCGDTLVASTLAPALEGDLARELRGESGSATGVAQEIQLGSERYLANTVGLSADGGPPVSLSVLKSLDHATSFLRELNHVLLGLGLLSVLAGSALVFLISHTFTRPLENLVAGVHALEQGDFGYPLESAGGDEVAEVTAAFDRMRASLQKTQNEHKQLEERLRQAHKMEAVGRLAGGVAHDFNNLLTVICGNSDLLLDREGLDDAARRSVDQIQKAAGRAVSMTRQLLAFSRMQVLQPRVLDLNAIVVDMGKMLPRLIGEDIEYVFHAEPKLAPVKADPGQIEQVILNLAVNARDAMPSGGTLTVRSRNIALDEAGARKRVPMSPGHYVLLSVADTGHGMDEATKTHIFEPFFTTKGVGKGTGLGLATVYGVVKQSGGFIWVESSPGKGTTFEIYLPQALESASELEAESRPSAMPLGHETILVVEDEAGVRELACQFLRGRGYSVLEAKDGLEAMEIVERHGATIHLILSDMVMPRMGGAELAARLKSIRPEVKVVLMSGYSEYSNSQADADSFHALVLQKPFTLPTLVGKVREALMEPAVEQTSGLKG